MEQLTQVVRDAGAWALVYLLAYIGLALVSIGRDLYELERLLGGQEPAEKHTGKER